MLLLDVLHHPERRTRPRDGSLPEHAFAERRKRQARLPFGYLGTRRKFVDERVRLGCVRGEPRHRLVDGGEARLYAPQLRADEIPGVALVGIGLVLDEGEPLFRDVSVYLAAWQGEQRADIPPRALAHAAQSLYPRAAQHAHEHGLGLVVGVVGERHEIALPRRDQPVEDGISEFAGSLFEGEFVALGIRRRVHAHRAETYAALPAERRRELRVADGALSPYPVLDMDGEKVRARREHEIRERDRIPPARKGERYARPLGKRETKPLSVHRFHILSIEQARALVHPGAEAREPVIRCNTSSTPRYCPRSRRTRREESPRWSRTSRRWRPTPCRRARRARGCCSARTRRICRTI